MERVTKIAVIAWSVAAIAIEIWLLRGAWPGLPLTALIAAAVVAAVSIYDRRVVAVVLGLAYVFPALVYWRLGHYFPQYIDVWLALLLAAIIPHSLRTSWHLPGRWRAALVGWALVTITGATIVSLREIDFTAALFNATNVANAAGGAWPAFIIRWVLHVALLTTVGILWFDWLIGAADLDFERTIALPLACSALGLAIAAMYQMFVDIWFINPTLFGVLHRAGGTVFDANLAGTLAALWIGGSTVLASRHRTTAPYAIPAAATIAWLAVWATGSRTAFATAAIVTLFSGASLVKASGISRRATMVIVAAGILAGLGFLFAVSRTELGAVGPLARFRASIPDMSGPSIRAVLADQLWDRDGYGIASTLMIERFPWFGVGVGSFQTLLPEFAAQTTKVLPPDNAQNWYRHQIAELGLIGSLPWILWLAALGRYVLDARRTRSPAAWAAGGMLLAFAAISFVGMPGQDPMVAITFWTIVVWFVRMDHPEHSASLTYPALAAIAVLLVVFAAGTVHAAVTDLRVPVRAQRGGWSYSAGFYRPGEPRFGAGPGWTARRAVAVVQPRTEWVAVTVSADHRAVPGSSMAGSSTPAPVRPSDVKVWCDGTLVVDTTLTTTAPLTTYVRGHERGKWLLLESQAGRLVPLQQLGIDDRREIGIQLTWTDAAHPAPQGETRVCGS